MCLQCIRNVTASYEFKKQSESAYETLKTLLGIQIYKQSPELNKNQLIESTTLESPPLSIREQYTNEIIDFNTDLNVKYEEREKNVGPNEKCIQTEEICFYPCEMCEMKFINEVSLRVCHSFSLVFINKHKQI